jgi:hypothetical protein
MNPHIKGDAIASHLAAQFDGMQEVVCRQILHIIPEIAQPTSADKQYRTLTPCPSRTCFQWVLPHSRVRNTQRRP